MSIYPMLLAVIVLSVCACAGLLRPTGLAGRTHAEEEEERRRDAAAKWLNKDDGRR